MPRSRAGKPRKAYGVTLRRGLRLAVEVVKGVSWGALLGNLPREGLRRLGLEHPALQSMAWALDMENLRRCLQMQQTMMTVSKCYGLPKGWHITVSAGCQRSLSTADEARVRAQPSHMCATPVHYSELLYLLAQSPRLMRPTATVNRHSPLLLRPGAWLVP